MKVNRVNGLFEYDIHGTEFQPCINDIGGSSQTQYLKKGIWLYFILLIFEGALRKWVLPDLATPILIIRDPLAIWLILKTWQKGLLPANFILTGMFLVGVFGMVTATLQGHGNMIVAIYGARIFMIHFPLIFVIGSILNREDVIKIGKYIVFLSIPMVVLLAFQFYSPQWAWVNRGVGGDMEGAGFGGALGFFRPPGTFSFTNGNTLFYSLATCFIFYFWITRYEMNRIVLIMATVSLLLAIPLSISRGLLFSVVVTVCFLIISISQKPELLGKMIIGFIGTLVALLVLSQTAMFQTAIEVFSVRIENASISEGGLKGTLVDRFLGGLLSALVGSSDNPFLGHGLGMGTNVASQLLSGGRGFLLEEEEWARLIGELGPLMGLAVIFLRVRLSLVIAFRSFQSLKSGDLLPWMLLSFGLLLISQGPWAQPTALGFSTFVAGMIIASFNGDTQK